MEALGIGALEILNMVSIAAVLFILTPGRVNKVIDWVIEAVRDIGR